MWSILWLQGCGYRPCIYGSWLSRQGGQQEFESSFLIGSDQCYLDLTDATGNIQKTCIQEFHVYTDKKMETPCDTADLPRFQSNWILGECAIKADSDKFTKVPYAIAPCTGDTIIGHLQTPLSSLVQSGVHHLIWVIWWRCLLYGQSKADMCAGR